MNQFDFYVITLYFDNKRQATKLGFEFGKGLQSEKTMVRYGRQVFPKFTYNASVDFVDAQMAVADKTLVDTRIAMVQAKYPGVRVHASYIARD